MLDLDRSHGNGSGGNLRSAARTLLSLLRCAASLGVLVALQTNMAIIFARGPSW